ncbi:hypothetical protein JKF61_17770 [Klebsiella quasipneumoniae]|uniref:hypothetical protein n=1 Tax=Klebsiella quasipneumoniae TaxID=1463165 RepID=UPI0021CB2985|nr:hypothetical protein [Klebsiella quasipneumoniae]MCU4144273.1 hypothetical protein [Klebsiella quasipneumoniae]MCU4151067.1 hypothetical protein [Klebsiella quasipneumoniae]
MFNSLSDYLQQQRDREEALKRKLSQLKPTVRNGEAGEIIAALIDLGSVGVKWFTEFGHLNRGDMLTSEQHRCHNEKKKFQRRV